MTDTPIDVDAIETTDRPSTAIERAEPMRQPTLATDERYMASLPGFARQFSNSGMCPEVWRSKPIPAGANENAAALIRAENEQKVNDLCVVGQSLAELDIRFSMNVIPQVYVVKGRPGYMAQLQILLAGRHGIPIVPLDDESDEKSATVKIIGKDRQWHRVTVTMEEAKKAKWPERNPNYETMPDRMLMARATTKAIDRHAPEIRMMLPPANLEELTEDDIIDAEDLSASATTGEIVMRIADAKGKLLEAVMASGQTDRAAAAQTAGLLWATHGLPSGDGRVPRSQVDELIAKIPPAPDQAVGGDAGVTASEPPADPVAAQSTPQAQGVQPSLTEQLDASLAKGKAAAAEAPAEPEYGPDEEPF